MTDYQSRHTGAEIDDGIDDAQTALQPADIINNLTSTDTDKALSAAQGKALEDAKFDSADLVTSLTSTSDVLPLAASQGKILQDGKVPNARTIGAGTGLTGGGDLSANRTIALDAGADLITYDNYVSGLTSTDVQNAIDELSDANGIAYDNSTSGMTATDVKAALDELAAAVFGT